MLGISPTAFGHGSEYVFAKLSLSTEPRRVELELSLEFLENPLVESKAQARRILSTDVLIESASGRLSLGEIAEEVEWSEQDRFDASAPISGPDPGAGEEHKILLARLDLSGLDADSINLRIVEGSLQAVIFWVDEPASESDSVRRVFLVAGESSPSVALPQKSRLISIGAAWSFAALGAGLVALAILRRWGNVARKRLCLNR